MDGQGIFFLSQLRYMLRLRRSSLILVTWHRMAFLSHQDDRVFEIRIYAHHFGLTTNAAIEHWESSVFDNSFDNPALQKFFDQARISKEEITFSLEACGFPAPPTSLVRFFLGFRGMV